MYWVHASLLLIGFAALLLWAYWDEFDYWYEYQLRKWVEKEEKENG